MPLCRRDLQLAFTLLNASRDPERPGLQERIARAIAEASAVVQWGARVFQIRLPLAETATVVGKRGKNAGKARQVRHILAPTMNEYSSMEGWAKAKIRDELDRRIMAELHLWPVSRMGIGARRRAVRVTRFSSSQPDELSVDVLGGKMPIDRLVHAGILRGDTAEDLHRQGAWERAKAGQGSVLVEVHEIDR